MTDPGGYVRGHLLGIITQPHDTDVPVFVFIGLLIVVQPVEQCIGKKSIAFITIHRRLKGIGRSIDVQAHLLGQYRHPGVI